MTLFITSPMDIVS